MLAPAQFGLSPAEYSLYMEGLRRSHEVRVRVQVLDNSHNVLDTLSHMLISGQVDCEISSSSATDIVASRLCTMQFLDPNHSFALDANDPNSGAFYFDRMVRVYYEVRIPAITRNLGWVSVPVFTGPITKLTRTGTTITVEARGKEEFGLGAAWTNHLYRKGTPKVSAIRSALAATGELSKHMDIPTTGGDALPADKVVADEGRLYTFAYALSQSVVLNGSANWALHYDGRGFAVLRPLSKNPAVTMKTGPGGFITNDVELNYSTVETKNVVKVKGRKSATAAGSVTAHAVAPYSHPLSPRKLGRNGKLKFLALVIDSPAIIGQAAAQQYANETLVKALSQRVEATWECLPVPHLDPWDYVNLRTDRFNVTVPITKFSLPLTVDRPMTCGFLLRVSRPHSVRTL